MRSVGSLPQCSFWLSTPDSHFVAAFIGILMPYLPLFALTVSLSGLTFGAAQAQHISKQHHSRVGEVALYAAKAKQSADGDQVLQLDDGSAENAIGFNNDTNNDGTGDQSLGALYSNRFTPPFEDFPLELQNVRIQFSALDENGNVDPGGVSGGGIIDIYVWSDPDGDPATGATLELLPSAPNPFAASTQLRYALPKNARVDLYVYDLLGRRVATLVDTKQPAGRYTVMLDGEDLTSGTYFVRLRADTQVRTQRVTVVR